MKSIRIYFPVLFLLLLLPSLHIFAADAKGGYEVPSRETIASMTKEQKEARMVEMKARVKEIKAMDKSKLTKEERKDLRMELKSMNKEAHAMGYTGGVYISVGALIIIILLLILILH